MIHSWWSFFMTWKKLSDVGKCQHFVIDNRIKEKVIFVVKISTTKWNVWESMQTLFEIYDLWDEWKKKLLNIHDCMKCNWLSEIHYWHALNNWASIYVNHEINQKSTVHKLLQMTLIIDLLLYSTKLNEISIRNDMDACKWQNIIFLTLPYTIDLFSVSNP